MGWDKGGRYYTRSRRLDGRVIREYVGTGEAAALIARMDALEREKRETDRQSDRTARETVEALDAPLNVLDDLAELVFRAAMFAAGFHQHHRGDWRKRRDDARQAE